MPNFAGATEIIYDNDHAKARARAFKALPEWTTCARGKHPMWKWDIEGPDKLGRYRSALHYDHNGKRTGYIGFSCAKHNRKAGAAEGGRRATMVFGRRRRRRPTRHRPSTGTNGPGW